VARLGDIGNRAGDRCSEPLYAAADLRRVELAVKSQSEAAQSNHCDSRKANVYRFLGGDVRQELEILPVQRSPKT
jgi:hypothetical protein